MSTVTVTPTYEPATDDLPPRVRLDISDSGTPAVTSVTITRLDPDGRLVPVRTNTGDPLPLSAAAGLVYDYEVPYGQPVYYSTLESPAVVSAAVTVTETRTWLIHPGVPDISTPVLVQEWGARSRRSAQGVFYPMGRTTPIVFTDGQRKSSEYQLTLLTQTDDERAKLDTLLADASPLLLNEPADRGFGIGAEYVSIGDVTESRLIRYAGNPMRTWTLPCTVVARPAGGSQATRTWTDVLIDYGTWSDVMAAYPTWLSVLAGP